MQISLNIYNYNYILCSVDLVTLDDLSPEAMMESSERVGHLSDLYQRKCEPLSDPGPPGIMPPKVNTILNCDWSMSYWSSIPISDWWAGTSCWAADSNAGALDPRPHLPLPLQRDSLGRLYHYHYTIIIIDVIIMIITRCGWCWWRGHSRWRWVGCLWG